MASTVVCAARKPPASDRRQRHGRPSHCLARLLREPGPKSSIACRDEAPSRVEQGDVAARPHLHPFQHQPQSSDARRASLPPFSGGLRSA